VRNKEMELEKIKNARTSYIGKDIVYFEEIDSTQEEARRRLQEGSVQNGTIFIADWQSNGQGTKMRRWYASHGENIMMTIFLMPNWDIKRIEGLTTKIAVVIQEAIEELYGYRLEIKEPNDLLLHHKKICGILTQAITRKETVEHLLIGIGFNVNEEVFPEEIREMATSLKKEYKKVFYREDIIVRVIEKLEKIL